MKFPRLPLWLEFALAVFAALAISNAATAYFVMNAHESRLASHWADGMAERAGIIAATLLDADPTARGTLLTAVSGPGQQFALSKAPIVAQGDQRDAELEALLGQASASLKDRDIRVKRVPFEAFERGVLRRPPDGPFGHGGPMPGQMGRALVLMQMSVNAGPEGWINAEFGFSFPVNPFRPFLFSSMVALFAISIAAYWMARRIARPLEGLATAATALKRGEPPGHVPETGPHAVKAATRSFNAMSQRLMATLESQRLMLAAVAHDLRTPITGMRLRTEMVQDEELKARLSESLDEMQSMTEAVLDAARADRSGEPTRRIDLAALTESLCADLAELGGAVTCAPMDSMPVSLRANEVRRVLRNLIENALRYGQSASVSLVAERGMARVHIDDEGPGIPQDQIERVFEPFARLEASRSRATGGHGLGLAIARLIARAHGGDVTLSNRPQGGLRATLALPSDAPG